jgi:hypothetical protein
MQERGFETDKSNGKWYCGVALRDPPKEEEAKDQEI